MIGATAKAEQFFTRSANESTKGSRKGFDLLGGGVNPTSILSLDEKLQNQRKALIAELQLLVQEAKELDAIKFANSKKKNRAFFDATQRIKDLKIRQGVIAAELTKLKAQTPSPIRQETLERCFMDVAVETLTKAQFSTLLKAARQRALELGIDAAQRTGEAK
jgi:hypothetical protein